MAAVHRAASRVEQCPSQSEQQAMFVQALYAFFLAPATLPFCLFLYVWPLLALTKGSIDLSSGGHCSPVRAHFDEAYITTTPKPSLA